MNPSATPPERTGRLRSAILVVLAAAGLINFLDRSALSIANTSLRMELGLTGTQIGLLLSTFSLAYGLAQLPAGRVLDRFGTRAVLGFGMVCWSVAQMLTGLVSGFASLALTRAALGAGEAPFFPGGVKVIRDWYREPERGLPMGILNASTTVGQALAPPALTLLLVRYGWRSMFVSVGLLGLAPAVGWFSLYRGRAPATASTVREILPGWRHLFAQRTMWGMMLGFSGINYTAWLYLAWLPGYFESAHHLSIARTGWLAAAPFAMGSAGMLVNGALADFLIRRGTEPLRTARRLAIFGMICSAACTLSVTRAASSGAAVMATGTALFFIHFAGTSGWGLVQAATPGPLVATAAAAQNFCSFLFASVAPVLTGWLLDRTRSFDLALVICAGFTIAGAAAYLLLVRRPLR